MKELSQKELRMAVGLLLGATLTDDFEIVVQIAQLLLVEKGVENAMMFLFTLKDMKNEQAQFSQFLDKHKQEYNALTKTMLNELEKELRLEEKEDE